jgi:hypothetical protein
MTNNYAALTRNSQRSVSAELAFGGYLQKDDLPVGGNPLSPPHHLRYDARKTGADSFWSEHYEMII